MKLEIISVDEANAINNSSPAFQNLRMGDRLKNITDAILELNEKIEKSQKGKKTTKEE